MAKKRKKAATRQKAAAKKIEVQTPVEQAPLRHLLLTTNGVNVFVERRTMSVPEAKNALAEALQLMQSIQQQALQAMQQQASQGEPSAEQPPADKPAPQEPSPPAEEVAEKPSGEASALHLAKPN